MSIEFLGILILVLLLIWFVGIPIIKNILRGAEESFVCAGECLSGCPSGYDRAFAGDPYCREEFGASTVCCEAGSAGGSIVRGGDVRIYYNKELDTPLRNGESVTLAGIPGEDRLRVGGVFSLSFGSSVSEKRCYWQLTKEEETRIVAPYTVGDTSRLMGVLWEAYNDPKVPHDAPAVLDLPACKEFTGTSSLILGEEEYLGLLGERLKFTLVVVDEKACDFGTIAEDEYKTAAYCDVYTHTFYAEVPDRDPRILLTMDGKAASKGTPTSLAPGSTHTFELTVADPLARCAVTVAPTINLSGGALELPFQGVGKEEGYLYKEESCFSRDRYTQRFHLTIPESHARAIPFELLINTSLHTKMNGNDRNPDYREVIARYPFVIAPDPRFAVEGPASGLSKEKGIEALCKGIDCTAFAIAYVANPLDCNALAPPASFVTIGSTGYGNGRWRFTLKGEEENGKYVCVKASSDAGALYALGTHRGVPTRKAIDAQPPTLSLDYDSWNQALTMRCEDQPGPSGAAYMSGCGERPFSYAFITNPLVFAGSVITGGLLLDTFDGCPDLDEGNWVVYATENPVYEHRSRDIRVICVRATDNAGNHVKDDRLLYSSPEMLALLLRELAQEGKI